MKYPKILAVLEIASLNIQTGLFGQKAHARFDEEQLQKLEDQMSQTGGEDLTTKLNDLQGKYDALQIEKTALDQSNTGLQNAISEALDLNGLTAEVKAETTPAQAVELLGTKCKEYGESNNRHSFPKNDGKEKEEDPDPSKEYAHNQIMSDKSKFKTIN